MSADARTLIAAYRRLHDQLAARVGAFSPSDVNAQSYCTEWTVAQVLSHLGSGAVIGLGVLTAVVAGDDLPGQEANVAVWDEWNAKSPEAQAADFITADEHLVSVWEGLDDAAIDAIHIERWGMQLDGPSLVLMRLSEFVLHAWDIEVTFDDDATLDAEATPWLLERLPMMAARAAHPEEAGMAGQTVAIRTTAPASWFTLDLGDPITMTAANGSPGGDDAVLPTEALIRLVYGRLDSERVPDGPTSPRSC